MGPTGPQGTIPDDVFASFLDLQGRYTNGMVLPLFPSIIDDTGNIVSSNDERIILAPGYYLISYQVSATFSEPNYMQITPFYNGMAHLEYDIYFATSADGSSACGSAYLILRASQQTEFFLTFSSSGTALNGQLTLTVLKLRKPL